jgi:hypothetical protein
MVKFILCMYLDLLFELHDITKVITMEVLISSVTTHVIIMSWFSSHITWLLCKVICNQIVLMIVLNNHVLKKIELITCYTMFKTCG